MNEHEEAIKAALHDQIKRLRKLCGEAAYIIDTRYRGVLDQYAHSLDDYERDILFRLKSAAKDP